MKIKELQIEGAKILRENNIDNAVFDSKELLKYVFELNETDLFLRAFDEAAPEKEKMYFQYIAQRSTHYPLQYITHSAGFMHFDFFVDKGVLIPRQDTEILVEEALKYVSEHYGKNPVKVLDMCTGSGCIGLSFQLERKAEGCNDEVYLVDISEKALKIAEKNKSKLGAAATIIQSDLYSALDNSLKFDIILSNPPYIRSDVIPTLMEEVKDHEPMLALDGDEDGLKFYRKIIENAPDHLNPGGSIYLEIGFDQYEDTRKLLVDNHFTDIRLYKDLAGLDRVVYGRLAES